MYMIVLNRILRKQSITMKMKPKIIRLFLLAVLYMQQINVASAQTYNIKDYGEVSDTNKVCTAAIQRAIDVCHANGGGRVLVPAGLYKSGTVVLKDHVELHLASGACLVASSSVDDFPCMPIAPYRSLKEGKGWFSLIYAQNAHDISITGRGVIDGRGHGRKGAVSGVAGDSNGRPRNILFISCKNVHVDGITMRNSALWNQHYLDCEDVTVTDIKVWNHCNGNNDGIDIDGCRRFILSNSIIDSDDDGIVLKSTGLAPCEDVVVKGCIVSSWANAIKLGTESTGGYKNILIVDCQVKPSANKGKRIIKSTVSGISAISLELVDGGIMDGVTVDNIQIDGTECPIYVRLGNRARKHVLEAPEPQIGKMRNIVISNIHAYHVGNFGSSITGIIDGKIENISLSNIYISNRGGLKKGSYRTMGDNRGKCHDMSGNLFANQYWKSAKEVKEDDKGYPQPTVWGNLPCYGLFVRHVNHLRMNNVVFTSENEEPRKVVIMQDVRHYEGQTWK